MISQSIIDKIQNNINESLILARRNLDSCRLMAVTKTRSIEEILTAKQLNLTLFGENRVQESLEKFQGRLNPSESNFSLHLIGQLQSNKVKKAVGFFDTIQSVDSQKLAINIAEEAQKKGIIQNIFLEQNCSGEQSKSGFQSLDDLRKTAEILQEYTSIKITGLMTIAPFVDNETEVRNSFIRLRKSFEVLKNSDGLASLVELSMGMSSDYQWAIEEGSTLVRIGTDLFGARSYGAKNE